MPSQRVHARIVRARSQSLAGGSSTASSSSSCGSHCEPRMVRSTRWSWASIPQDSDFDGAMGMPKPNNTVGVAAWLLCKDAQQNPSLTLLCISRIDKRRYSEPSPLPLPLLHPQCPGWCVAYRTSTLCSCSERKRWRRTFIACIQCIPCISMYHVKFM